MFVGSGAVEENQSVSRTESVGQPLLSFFDEVFCWDQADASRTTTISCNRQSFFLSRLRSWRDEESWQEFFDTYGRLIYRMAMKAGLSDAEAQDVVQETIILVARKMPGFKYDPAIGSFKSWLRLLTRRRIEKQLKKRLPGIARLSSASGGSPPWLLTKRGEPRRSTASPIPRALTSKHSGTWNGR